MSKDRPIIGITMGDPAGIGPEIAVKALCQRDLYDRCRPAIIGDAGVISDAVRIVQADLAVKAIAALGYAEYRCGTIDVLDLNNVDLAQLNRGCVCALAGNAAFEAIRKAIDLALACEIDATVTGPINKEALNAAGHHFAGHTEIYAHLTNTRDYAMMLAHEDLRVVHVTTHVSLRQACDLIKRERVLTVIKLADQACRRIGLDAPRLGVAGLNPHSGDGGLFGDEETTEIIPAIEQARSLGIDADGPIPADTMFSKAKGGWYDICIVMYHDQGHIPVKLAGFVWNETAGQWDSVCGVNITLGLPIIRTSVDHGTAFDQAGTGRADETSLVNAIDYAIMMADNSGR